MDTSVFTVSALQAWLSCTVYTKFVTNVLIAFCKRLFLCERHNCHVVSLMFI